MSNKKRKILLVAGEASGDLHTANLAKALLELDPNLYLFGVGGKRMTEAGVDVIFDSEKVSVVGFSEVISRASEIWKLWRLLLRRLKEQPPDLVILTDYPGLNLRLAKQCKKRQIPVIYYISPQIWAWRPARLKKIKKVVDLMLVILPFEEEIFKKEGIPVLFTGHPLVDTVKPGIESLKVENTKELILKEFDLTSAQPIVGLLPGSRLNEVDSLLPIMQKATVLLAKRNPEIQFVLIRAETIQESYLQNFLNKNYPPVKIISNKTYELMSLCDVLIVASGTATLEAALCNTPLIVIYKVSFLTWLLAKALIKIKHIGLVNVVAGSKIVPELVQYSAKSKKIAEEAEKFLSNPDNNAETRRRLALIRDKLGPPGAYQRTGKFVLEFLNNAL